MTAGAPVPEAIERLLRPRSVAIVGASPTPGALGASVLANLERMQYTGQIHLINPKRDEIGGRPCLKSIDDLPAGVDAAVLAIPRAGVLGRRARARRTPGWCGHHLLLGIRRRRRGRSRRSSVRSRASPPSTAWSSKVRTALGWSIMLMAWH